MVLTRGQKLTIVIRSLEASTRRIPTRKYTKHKHMRPQRKQGLCTKTEVECLYPPKTR